MSLYAQMAVAAEALLKKSGQTMTLVKSSVGAYDPSTGSASATDTSYSVSGVSIAMPSKGIGVTSVERGDKKVIIQSGVAEPTLSDSIIIGGVYHELLDVKPINPGGEVVIYILHCRAGG